MPVRRATSPSTSPSASPSVSQAAPRPAGPVVIGHRGACGYRPEHTLASYELAVRQGADLIEPDLVATRDGVLVARHENQISGTTDVATRPELADRRRTRMVDGVEVDGWFTEDLTLAELRELRAVERLPGLRPRNREHDGRHRVPTFEEVLALRGRLSRELGREIGVYPETKHPTHFRELGVPLEEPLLEALRGAGLDRADAPVFVQSFELSNLVMMRLALGSQARQVLLATGWDDTPYDLTRPGRRHAASQVWGAVRPDVPDALHASAQDLRVEGAGPAPATVTYRALLSPAGLEAMAGVVDGIGPDKTMVVPWGADGALAAPTRLVADAHAAGMVVHPWTFRAENAFLPPALRNGPHPAVHGRLREEVAAYLAAGVDGVFSDHPDVAVAARDAHVAHSPG